MPTSKRLSWANEALDELEKHLAWYAERNPAAAERMGAEIDKAALSLVAQPIAHPGRAGFIQGTRELVVRHRTPFTLIYREKSSMVEILHVWHQSQDMPE
jgi:plasmid stabilization system protein ParE